jgi:hydroxymethylbilane synthase
LYQAEFVKTRILRDFPMISVEIVIIKTSGDMVRHENPSPLGTKRIYTREIEEALLAGSVDVAVHSAKDLAAQMPEGLRIGAVMEREDPRDCLVSDSGFTLANLPPKAKVGTSALRRKMQLLRHRPDLIIEELHGNVGTRIRRMQEGKFQAIVLALAGIHRLGLESHVSEILPEDRFYPAPGQGVIVVQSRDRDPETDEILKVIHHKETGIRLDCERSFMKYLEGGCQLPCGIATVLEGHVLKARGALFAVDDASFSEGAAEGTTEDPAGLGVRLAERILEKGGREILAAIRAKYGKK